jgi:hypothetical protein
MPSSSGRSEARAKRGTQRWGESFWKGKSLTPSPSANLAGAIQGFFFRARSFVQ